MSAKRFVIVTVVAMLCVVAFTPAAMASQRRHELRATKECSEQLGNPGDFCTFISSNVPKIGRGDRIYYFQAATPLGLDSDVAIYAGPGNVVNGHCTLVIADLPGRCTFWGGTGKFEHFRARASVSVDEDGIWHWEGTYSFRRPDND
jgi:hypothetical protein